MNPAAAILGSLASLAGLGVGIFGVVDGIPMLAGGGFAVTAALQVWTMGKLGPINVRLAVIEERLCRLEDEAETAIPRRTRRHDTPPIQ